MDDSTSLCDAPVAAAISVVVPAYRAERWIAHLLAALAAQTYPPREIVVVDDASPDGTAAAAEACAKESGIPLRLLRHERNRGVSAARNTGLDAARGEYVLFLDADDDVDPGFLQALHARISDGAHDAAFCGMRRRDAATGRETPESALSPASAQPGEALAAMRLRNEAAPHLCSILFRREFLRANGLRFADGCIAGEDVEFAVAAFALAASVAYTPERLYVYVEHEDMGSRREADTREKWLNRYAHNTEAHLRLAQFLVARARTPELRRLAEGFLYPQAYCRLLTLHAKRGDRTRFDAALRDPAVRAALRKGARPRLKKTEVFFKSLCLLLLPGLFYRMRAQN